MPDGTNDLADDALNSVQLFRPPVAQRLCGVHSREAYRLLVERNGFDPVDTAAYRGLVRRADIERVRGGRRITAGEVIAALVAALRDRGVGPQELYL